MGLIILGTFVVLVMLVGNIAETRAHRSPKFNYPDNWWDLEDLRLSYAPDLRQVTEDQAKFQQKQYLEEQMAEVRRVKEMYDHHARKLQDAKIKRWLEGNPPTEENPLTKKELPPSPRHKPYISSPFL